MFFTQEDYRKIEKWLLANSRKDTDFVGAATPLKGNETVVLVQDGKNVKTSVKDIVDQFFLLGVSDFLNITDKYGESYISLTQAIQLIPFRSRKEGQVITFIDESGNWAIYQFQGKALNQWNNTTLWIDLLAKVSGIPIIDSEDITTKENGAKQVSLYLADKQYNEADYSGLGRIYLRKNIYTVVDPSTGAVINVNLLTQSMLAKENTTYIIQYDYNLNKQTISIPEGSVLLFEGGSIDNGTINCNGTTIVGKFSGNATIVGTYSFQDAQADEEDITQNQSSVLKFKDRKYEPDKYSGLGRVILRKNIVEIDDPIYGKVTKNILFQGMIAQANIIYEIRYDYNLNGNTVTIPEGCILDMRGGSVTNGTINCVDTIIISTDASKLDVTLTGTYRFDSEKLVTSNTEDINISQSVDRKSHTISAMLADRDTTNGMGYVILRKDKSFKEQVTQENTIYEIRYDFDLEGESTALPINCILDFKGGKLLNGTISLINGNLEIYNGNFYKIALYPTNSVIKIFNSIFDCNNEISCPIWAIHTPIYVYNSKFVNIGNSSQNNCSGILFYGDCSRSIIRDCYFENIVANTNATGVHFGQRDNKVSYNFLIENCEFHNINGITDDGDGIKVIYGSHGENYYANAIINNCKFYDCSKRAIKLQSRGIKVTNIYIENKCNDSCIDFQMGNAYIENVVMRNINSYKALAIAKITGYNYINNIDCEYLLDEERYGSFIRIESSTDDYDDNNSIIITNCNCNKITSRSYSNIMIDFRYGKTTFNIKEIILKNLKGLKTGPSNTYCYMLTGNNDIYCNFLKIENIIFDYITFGNDGTKLLQVNNYRINQNTREEFLNAKFGTLNFLTNGLYYSTPMTKVFIQNGKRVFTNLDVNDINLIITNSIKNTAVLGDTIVTLNNQYTLINLPSEENPNGIWQALIN